MYSYLWQHWLIVRLTLSFIFGNSDKSHRDVRGREDGRVLKWQFEVSLSLELVLSKVSFRIVWPFLRLLLLLPHLFPLIPDGHPCVTRAKHFPSSSSISTFHLHIFMAWCTISCSPPPPFFPFTGFSFLSCNIWPFFSLVSITFRSRSLPSMSLSFPSHCLPLLNTFLSSTRSSLYPSPYLHLAIASSPPPPPLSLPPFLSSISACSIGWLSWRSLPWSSRRQCTTTSTRGPQTTSTFRQGNGS